MRNSLSFVRELRSYPAVRSNVISPFIHSLLQPGIIQRNSNIARGAPRRNSTHCTHCLNTHLFTNSHTMCVLAVVVIARKQQWKYSQSRRGCSASLSTSSSSLPSTLPSCLLTCLSACLPHCLSIDETNNI